MSAVSVDVSRPYPDQAGTLGALLRRPYSRLAEHLFGSLAAKGYEEIRPAHSTVFRHLLPKGSRLTDLADAAGITKQSMAYLINDLEGMGYVQMSPDPVDGRAKLVKLTARGRKLMQTLLQTSADMEARIAREIGEKEIQHLRRLLTALDGVLGNLGN